MVNMSFDKVSFFYNFMEKYILKDYKGSIDIFEKYLSFDKDICVIDVGGGTGFFSQSVFDDVSRYVVVDPSDKMIRKIKDNDILKVQGDGCGLSFKDDIFDLAIVVNVLHHINKKYHKQVLSEIFRILKVNGQVFIIEVFPTKSILHRLFCFFESILTGEIFHISDDKLQSYLKEVGFRYVVMKYPKEHDWKYVAIGKKIIK